MLQVILRKLLINCDILDLAPIDLFVVLRFVKGPIVECLWRASDLFVTRRLLNEAEGSILRQLFKRGAFIIQFKWLILESRSADQACFIRLRNYLLGGFFIRVQFGQILWRAVRNESLLWVLLRQELHGPLVHDFGCRFLEIKLTLFQACLL